MYECTINKGIGRGVELLGLRAQYIVLFLGGAVGIFLLLVVMTLIGISPLLLLPMGIGCVALLCWGTFHLNKKHGPHGLMKLNANHYHGRFLRSRHCSYYLLKQSKRLRNNL